MENGKNSGRYTQRQQSDLIVLLTKVGGIHREQGGLISLITIKN
jgi:hypothetical protein